MLRISARPRLSSLCSRSFSSFANSRRLKSQFRKAVSDVLLMREVVFHVSDWERLVVEVIRRATGSGAGEGLTWVWSLGSSLVPGEDLGGGSTTTAVAEEIRGLVASIEGRGAEVEDRPWLRRMADVDERRTIRRTQR